MGNTQHEPAESIPTFQAQFAKSADETIQNAMAYHMLRMVNQEERAEILDYLARAADVASDRKKSKHFEDNYRCSSLRVEYFAALIKYANDYPYRAAGGAASLGAILAISAFRFVRHLIT